METFKESSTIYIFVFKSIFIKTDEEKNCQT